MFNTPPLQLLCLPAKFLCEPACADSTVGITEWFETNAGVASKHWCCEEAILGLVMEPPCVVVNVIPEGGQQPRRRSGKWLLQMQVRGERARVDG